MASGNGYVRPSIVAAGAKVWTVGDSVTHGYLAPPASPTYEGAFRCRWYSALTAQGRSPNFVGTVTNASDGVACGGQGHSGYNGSTAASWNATYFAIYAASVQASFGDPDVVSIMLGFNDGDSAAAADQVIGVVGQACATFPNAVVLVNTLYPTGSSTYAALNARLRDEVARLLRIGKRVKLVEMASVFGGGTPPVDLCPDGLHPSTAGYALMGAVLENAIPY